MTKFEILEFFFLSTVSGIMVISPFRKGKALEKEKSLEIYDP